MAEIKPLGSEKLNSEDKLKRILELTYFNENKKSNSSTKPELVKESKTGGVFGIVKEKDGYYVKRGLNESSLDYIGGMFMKNKNKFSSYADALKRLNLLNGQENLQEATKYVLKQNKPQSEAPMPEPSMDAAPAPSMEPAPEAPAPEAPAPEAPTGEFPPADGVDMAGIEGGESSKRSDYMAEAQKFAGKLGQELRDLQDKMESDDIKYILNMIISAVDLDKLDDEDIEDIAKKFEREEEEGEEMGSEEPAMEPSPEAAVEPTSDEDLGENTMSALDEFINNPAPGEQNEISLDDFADLEMGNDELKEYNPLQRITDREIELRKKHRELKSNLDSEMKNDGPEPRKFNEPTNSFKHHKRPEIGAHGEEHMDEEVELDLDEMKREINNSIQATLGKYFK
jgi:hypothetical protein